MINEHFRIQTDQLSFTFIEGSKPEFLMNSKRGLVEIVYPPHTVFNTPQMQAWLFKVVIEALRKQARLILPERLQELAQQNGFNYTHLSINSARTRWGSCSSRRHINLSLFLMILPRHLSDYVLLHELCHTVEMNHGPRFWALMDKVTGQRAQTLRNELRHYPSPFKQD